MYYTTSTFEQSKEILIQLVSFKKGRGKFGTVTVCSERFGDDLHSVMSKLIYIIASSLYQNHDFSTKFLKAIKLPSLETRKNEFYYKVQQQQI